MIKIGNYNLKTNVVLAPMWGCADLAFRLICREHGAQFCFYEMVDANALVNNNRRVEDILQVQAADRPIAAQLVGSDPDLMLKAARKMLKMITVPFLDINAACPVRKLMKKGAGAFLLQKPKRLFQVIKTLADALPLPVTVKLRTGFSRVDLEEITAVARGCEKSGAAALFVHGRTRAQLYSGTVDYAAIKAVKQSVGIPVFGSGDIFSAELAGKMLAATSCDGVMVARGAWGNPWIFRAIGHYLRTGEKLPEVGLDERITVLKKHLSYIEKYKKGPPASRVSYMRKFTAWYLVGFPRAASLRGRVNQAKAYDELIGIVDEAGAL